MLAKRFKLEEYDLQCFTEKVIDAKGLTSTNLKAYVEEAAHTVILGPVLDDILDLRGEVLSDCAEKLDAVYALPYWIYTKELLQIATRHVTDERRMANRMDMLREYFLPALINTEKRLDDYKGNLPFIQTEAEWSYFDGYTNRAARIFIDGLITRSTLHIMENNFNKLNFASYLQRLTATSLQGKEHNGILQFSNAVGEDLSLDYRTNVEMTFEGIFMIITSYIKIGKKFEFRSDVEANMSGIIQRGTVKGTAESLTYAIEVKLNMKTNDTNLEYLHLECIGGLHVHLNGIDDKPWLSKAISGATRNYFVGIVMDDIDTIMVLAIKMGLVKNGENQSLAPPWNYDLDYSKVKQMKREREGSHYEVCTP